MYNESYILFYEKKTQVYKDIRNEYLKEILYLDMILKD